MVQVLTVTIMMPMKKMISITLVTMTAINLTVRNNQTDEAFIYSHKWAKDMLVMWDNRSLLHAATGGYDGYDRLLHRTTIADTRF